MTALVARPLMGKTWVLNDLARRLTNGGECLVGYHESTGAESSHLLYAVSNLYARWLTDSSMRAQAVSLWHRHQHELVPRVAQMIGSLFDKLGGKQFPDGVGSLVSGAFDGLAGAQKDLLSGGLSIAPLPYDQALSLTNLVARVSERRIILILDAWEKSPTIRAETTTLESFLKHRSEWPQTHVFLAIRNPEVDSTQDKEEAFRRAHDLCKTNPAAQVYELPPINLDSAEECSRMVSFVLHNVPAAQHSSEQNLLQMIANYPGVLYYWTDPAKLAELKTEDDLRKEADNAQTGRYPEFDHLLKKLEGGCRTLAARLAFFPRLDAERWHILRPLFIESLSDDEINALIDSTVLTDERFPTYGHDTRHAAARRWFIEHQQALIRRTAEALIYALAAEIKGTNSNIRKDVPVLEALAACSGAAQLVAVDSAARCLIDAAQSLFFSGIEEVLQPKFGETYSMALQINESFAPLICLALLDRGIAKGQRGDSEGEIADYSAAIDLPGAPPEQVAKALYNRGFTKGQRGDTDGEIDDYSAAIDLPGTPPEWVANALYNRGIAKGQRGDTDGKIADYSAAIDLPGAPPEQVARALYNRGNTKGRRGDSEGAIADYSAAIDLPGAPPEWVAKALVNRGFTKGQRGDSEDAIDDYSAAIDLPGAPPEQVAKALYNRGIAKGQRGDTDGKIADYSAAIDLPDAPPEQVAKALHNRGITKGQCGDSEGASADYTSVINLPGAPPEIVEMARRQLQRPVPSIK